MKATVDGEIHLPRAELPPSVMRELTRCLSFPNPAYQNALRFNGGNTGSLAPVLPVYRLDSQYLHLPRGASGLLKRLGVRVHYTDKRTSWPPIDIRIRPNLEARDYQAKARDRLIQSAQGCVVLPCGAGKTVVGLAALAEVQQPALIIVHTVDLVAQWTEAKIQWLEGNDCGQIHVVTVQSLAKLATSAKRLSKMASRYGALVVDECHHVPARTFRQIVPAFAARYRFGLTATAMRSDGLNTLIELTMGRTVFTVSHGQLVADGHLVLPVVRALAIDGPRLERSYAELIAALCADAARNDQICRLASQSARAGRSTLVLSNRVAHCHQLADAIDGAVALTGRVNRTERKRRLDAFRRGELPIVVATSLADEGLDVANLETVILATPSKAKGRTIQRLGRLMRPSANKRNPVLYDLVDAHPIARRHWTARKRAYKDVLGCSVDSPQPISKAFGSSAKSSSVGLNREIAFT